MRGLVQRVTRASVTVDHVVVGAIGPGLCVLIGVTHGDDEAAARKLADKIWGLRVFEDGEGRMNLSLSDLAATGGAEAAGVLVVSQFTLYADLKRGRRPSFDAAMPPEEAERAYEAFVAEARALGLTVATGRFRADMKVSSLNDGPVTIWVDSANR